MRFLSWFFDVVSAVEISLFQLKVIVLFFSLILNTLLTILKMFEFIDAWSYWRVFMVSADFLWLVEVFVENTFFFLFIGLLNSWKTWLQIRNDLLFLRVVSLELIFVKILFCFFLKFPRNILILFSLIVLILFIFLSFVEKMVREGAIRIVLQLLKCSILILLILLSMQSGACDIFTLSFFNYIIVVFIFEEILKMPEIVGIFIAVCFIFEMLLRFVVFEDCCFVEFYALVWLQMGAGVTMSVSFWRRRSLDGHLGCLSVQSLSEFWQLLLFYFSFDVLNILS